MNRGVLQSSPVQQMMAAGNPSWWNINNLMRPPIHHLGPGPGHRHDQPQLSPSSSSTSTNFLAPPPNNTTTTNNNSRSGCSNNDSISINNETNIFQAHHYMTSSWLDDHTNPQDHHHHSHLPESWSQLLMSGVCIGEEEDEAKKMERWEDQVVINQQTHHVSALVEHQVKQETSSAMDGYGSNRVNLNVFAATASHDQEFQLAAVKAASNWSSPSPQIISNNNNNNSIPASSPQSCVTTFSGSNCNSLLDFSSSKSSTDSLHANHPAQDRSSECNSTANGGVLKKAKVQPSSTQSTFKVRKEKLGDRITALHQLVSPFGKTDTASVLLEAIGYIRFLHNQIEALSLPYLSNGAGNKRQSHPVQGERNCIFPEDPGQLLNDNCLKRKGGPEQDSYEEAKDMRSRGLCLVPVSCTLHVGSDNGADYWAPALGGGFR